MADFIRSFLLFVLAGICRHSGRFAHSPDRRCHRRDALRAVRRDGLGGRYRRGPALLDPNGGIAGVAAARWRLRELWNPAGAAAQNTRKPGRPARR